MNVLSKEPVQPFYFFLFWVYVDLYPVDIYNFCYSKCPCIPVVISYYKPITQYVIKKNQHISSLFIRALHRLGILFTMLLMVKLCQGNATREVTTTETVLSLSSLTTPQTPSMSSLSETQSTPEINTTQTKTPWTTPLNYSSSTPEMTSLSSLTTAQTLPMSSLSETETTGINTTQSKTPWTTPLKYSISAQEMTSATIIYPEITQIIEKL